LYEGEKKVKRKNIRSGETFKGKWPYYDIMNFQEYYLQRRITRGNAPHRAAAADSFTDPEETEIGDSEMDGESTCYDQNVLDGSSKEAQPTRSKR
jgi:hypothetical protein